MPSLPGFSDNPFQTRDDLIHAAFALIKPLENYKSALEARIKLPIATGAGFSEHAAQLEGFARPLWLVVNLYGKETSPGVDLTSWARGLRHGTDPASPEYWGDVGDSDQRMVEMESIAYALLLNPGVFGLEDEYGDSTKANLVAWLKQINGRNMSRNNWRWFRVFVNLALHKTLAVPFSEVEETIRSDLEILDSFQLGRGWSSDGPWGLERRQADYYSGSFAIQFAQLLYINFAPDLDAERTERYKEQARTFAVDFWRYFDEDGAAIPFGRSLTYRFAFGAFWAAAAQADVQLPAPLDDPGTIKGMLLRHLRWWSKRPDIFHTDGSLSIGYTYPNIYLSEAYNSPQSVYWCLKSFLVAGLDSHHPFWTSSEKPWPAVLSPNLRKPLLLPQPRHILCPTREHHFLLSSGQYTKWNHKAKEAKYGKFAYSSALGFSVPVAGDTFEQVAPDSTLAVSWDEGASWKVHWDPYDLETGTARLGGESVPTLESKWRPWKFLDVEVRAILVPPFQRSPGWHLRVHEIYIRHGSHRSLLQLLQCADSGFSAAVETSEGFDTEEQQQQQFDINGRTFPDVLKSDAQGWWKAPRSVLISSKSGLSGVVDLTEQLGGQPPTTQLEVSVSKLHPNTNIMIQRSLIPSLRHTVDVAGLQAGQGGESPIVVRFVSGIFAVTREALLNNPDSSKMWQGVPKGDLILSADKKGEK